MDNIPSTYEAPRGRLLPTLVIFLFILGLFYTLYLFLSTHSLNNSVANLEENKVGLQRKIEVLNDQQIQELYNAEQLTKKIEENSVHWSQVLTRLNALTPVGVFFASYGLNEDGSIQVTGYGDSYASVADLIAAMEKRRILWGLLCLR
ncbi:hypothetical protein IPG41_02490 [Candidatus Peregrinibacteria bacterium]|nr:MAG: hypothetical protein IPG41_02490 [Candidatus Peregrinibacteria bacterium]